MDRSRQDKHWYDEGISADHIDKDKVSVYVHESAWQCLCNVTKQNITCAYMPMTQADPCLRGPSLTDIQAQA